MPAEDVDLLHRGKRIVDLDVKKEPGVLLELAAKADVLLDCFRPGTCERLGIGPAGLRGGQPPADLRPHHRLGTGRSAGDDRGPRHQLPVADRGAQCHRLPRPAARRAAEPGRRLRRRVDVRPARHRRRTLRTGTLGQGPGDRRRHGRRRQRPRPDDVDHEGDGVAEGSARVVPARRRCALLPHLRDAPTADTWPSARSNRSSSPS